MLEPLLFVIYTKAKNYSIMTLRCQEMYALGEFVLTNPKVEMPRTGKIYSINEGNYFKFDDNTRKLIDGYKKEGKKARYVGSMVADVHRTLFYGGIFLYPHDSKNPKGKLRLLYECNPIAMLCEQAGGACSNVTQRMLDVQPESLHGREPIVCGSLSDVEHAVRVMRGEEQ